MNLCRRCQRSVADDTATETHSTLDSRWSGFALSTTKMRMGTNASALSSFLRWRMKPAFAISIQAHEQRQGGRTEYDLATVQNADQLVSGSLVMIYFQELWSDVRDTASMSGEMRHRPCWANIRKPLPPSSSGISRCFSSTHPNKAIRCVRTRSLSRSSAVTGRGGMVRAT